MSLLRMSVIGGAILAASTAGALAADMPDDRPFPASPPPRFSQPAGDAFEGWYLRGDLGYRWQKNSSAEPAPGFLAPTNDKLNNTVAVGVGAGYKSGWFRADLTVDFTPPANYTGQVVTPGDTTAKVTATTVLANGYLDLGSWYGITPYVGAGAGIANMNISDYRSSATPPFASVKARGLTNFAWAGMAGVSYAISPNILIDAGYRYLSLGDAMTESDSFGSMRLKSITAHEVRVGLRWNFEDRPLGR